MSLEHVDIVFQVIAFLFAISVHESAHAWMANRCGDPTARLLGRISLNPIRHIDPIGTVILPALAMLYHFPMIGWAKPTPVNPLNFRRGEMVRSDILTSVAGPASNMLVASVAVVAMVVLALLSAEGHAIVHSLASGTLVDTESPMLPVTLILYEFMEINVLLAVFNLIPIPPLDGSHVLRHFLSGTVRETYDRVGMFGLLLFFLIGGRVIRLLMDPVMHAFNSILTAL